MGKGLIIKVRDIDLSLMISSSVDGGFIITIENESSGREVTCTVPVNGNTCYFSLTERGQIYKTGALSSDNSVQHLTQWVIGDVSSL